MKNNSKALSDIIYSILDSALNRVMHYATAKKVWDKLQYIHEKSPKEGCLSWELPGNHIPNNVSKNEHDNKTTFVISDGVVDSKEDRLEDIFDLRTKLDLALKNIDNL